jgi:hypothetical protein
MKKNQRRYEKKTKISLHFQYFKLFWIKNILHHPIIPQSSSRILHATRSGIQIAKREEDFGNIEHSS